MRSKSLRAVIVGGHIGRSHARAYQACPATELVAVCDVDPRTLQAFGDEFDVAARYTDFETMLREERPDLVSIGTPQWLHAPMAILAASYQPKAILSEKAMASSMGEARAMVAACDRAGVKLAIAHQGRFSTGNQRARELIAAGAIGTPLVVTLAPGKVNAGIMNILTHNLSYLMYILGDPAAEWVIANVQRESDRWERSFPCEDLAAAVVGFASGLRIMLESDTPPAGAPDVGARIFTGAEGVLLMSSAWGVRVLRKGGAGWESIPIPDDHMGAAREREIAALAVWATGERSEHPGDAHLALRTQEILMGIYESARTRGLVRLPLKTMASPLVAAIQSGTLPIRYPGRYDIRHVTVAAN